MLTLAYGLHSRSDIDRVHQNLLEVILRFVLHEKVSSSVGLLPFILDTIMIIITHPH